MTDELVYRLRGMVLPRGYNSFALTDAADIIEQQSKLLDQALEALGTCRVMGADDAGNYTIEITPRQIVKSIAAIKQFKEQK